MNGLLDSWMVIPLVILAMFIVGFAIVRAIMSCWKTVPPNTVAIVSGRKYRDGKGYKVIRGGGFFRIPVIERVDYISLNLMLLTVEVQDVPDKNGALLTVKGVANVKINSSDEHLPLAIERFLGKTEADIKAVAKDNLEGNLRGIVGNSTVEGLIGDRQGFQGRVLNEAGGDMAKLGLTVDLLNIQDIRDNKGYIESLGRKRTAEVIRDATIGEAEAKRDSDIKSAEARQQGSIATAAADQKISDADRERDLVIAQNKAQVEATQARIPIISQSAVAEEKKKLNVANVAAEQARVEAEIELQQAHKRRTEAELNATVIINAEKEKEARIIAAEATQQAATREGEALRIKAEKEGQGSQAKMTAEALGRIEQAKAVQAEKEAEAAGDKAQLLASAAGKEADLMAEASGRRAILLAEAEGTLKKAEAFKQLDEAGRMLLIIEALPPVINSLGEAIGKIIVPTAEAIGEGLANVDEIRIVDLGGGRGNGEGGNVLGQFLNAPPETINKLVEQLKASNMGPVLMGLFSKAGIDLSSVLGKKPDGQPVAVTPAPATPPMAVQTAAK